MSIKFNPNHITKAFKNELLEKCNLCNIANGITYPKSFFNMESKEKKQNDLNHFILQGGQAIPFYDDRNRNVGFVFIKGKEVTIAYRGTLDVYDAFTDLHTAYASIKFLPKGSAAHSGFYSAFKNSLDSLRVVLVNNEILTNKGENELQVNETFKVTFTGYSMGAAIAQIAALYVNSKYVDKNSTNKPKVTTFAGPLVFHCNTAKLYEEYVPDTLHVVNKVKGNILKSDLVPNVPPQFLDYERTGKKLVVSGKFNKSELKKDEYAPSCNRAFIPHTLRAYEKGINNLELTPLNSLTDVDIKAVCKSIHRD